MEQFNFTIASVHFKQLIQELSFKKFISNCLETGEIFKKKMNESVLDWDEYFMCLAVVASKRSKDRETKVGAVVVSVDKKVLGIGWNGHPKMRSGRNDDQKEGFSWEKNIENYKENKHFYVCHAELNAIVHSSGSLVGTTMYVTLNPCNECAKLIVQSGVKEVIYMEKRQFKNNSLEAAIDIFKKCKVDIEQFSVYMEKAYSNANRIYNPKTIEINLADYAERQ